MPDVDIDFFDRDNTLKLFKHTPASMIKDGKSEKHKTGVYFHAVRSKYMAAVHHNVYKTEGPNSVPMGTDFSREGVRILTVRWRRLGS